MAMVSGSAGAVISVLLPRQLLSLVPGPAQLVGDDLGDSGGGVVAFHFHNGSSAGVQKSYILNIRDIRQLSLRLDNLRLKERQNAGPKAQPAK